MGTREAGKGCGTSESHPHCATESCCANPAPGGPARSPREIPTDGNQPITTGIRGLFSCNLTLACTPGKLSVMRRLARCVLAAFLAFVLAAPTYAVPPPALAPVVTVAVPTPVVIVSISGRAPIVRIPADPPTPKPIPVPVPRTPTVADAQVYALTQLGRTQYNCLYLTAFYESKWNPAAWNGKGSAAYGIPQAKPGSKMASFGYDWAWNPITQVKWMIWYVNAKYGSACGAEAFRHAHGWY